MTETIVTFEKVRKQYDESTVLKEVSFQLEKGKFYTLLGPSGCGKTTLLKTINNLIPFDDGEILIKDKLQKDWSAIELR